MLSSAVSVGLALTGALGGEQLSGSEQKAWARVSPSVAVLSQNGRAIGCATLIDAGGYFLAHSILVKGSQVDARLSDGRTVQLYLKAKDEPTQLVLLQAQQWDPGQTKPARLAGDKPGKGERLLTVLPSGPFKAEYVSGVRVGLIDTSSRRMLPLSEIRFEGPSELVGGAPVFTLRGELVGILNATLRNREDIRNNKVAAAPGMAFGAGGGAVRGSAKGKAESNKAANNQFGPGPLTVAYSVTPTILDRVIDGFRSPSRSVSHPHIGIFCKDAPNKSGAVIESVEPGSNAEMGGLRRGDVMVEIAGDAINDQVDFGKVMFRQRVGDTIPFVIVRDGRRMTLEIRVGGKVARQIENLPHATSE